MECDVVSKQTALIRHVIKNEYPNEGKKPSPEAMFAQRDHLLQQRPLYHLKRTHLANNCICSITHANNLKCC